MRAVYLNGSIGQIVAGSIWLFSAALATWASPRHGFLALVFGGMFIFPLTQLSLRVLGRPASVSPSNPLRPLAIQVAFVVPVCIPLVVAAGMSKPAWFFPAFGLLVGAHYLPFVSLYGLRHYGALAALLISGSLLFALWLPAYLTLAAWYTGSLLLLFGILLLLTCSKAQQIAT